MTAVLAYLLLPAATWLLGSLLCLIDGADPAWVLRRAAWRGLPFLVVVLVLGPDAGLPALAALISALAAHLLFSWGVRAATLRGWWRDDAER